MSITQEEIIEYLDRASATEFAAIIAALRSRLGIPPVPPPMGLGGVAILPPIMGEYDPAAEFSVRLLSVGPDKIAVVRLVRTLFEGKIGLGEAKELVERAPVVLWDQSLSRAEAKEKVEALLAVGASAERF